MSPDWITAISSFATFVVIAASALAALIQLKHVRVANQIAVLNDVRHRLEKHRMGDPDSSCDLWYVPVVPCWDPLAPFISSSRAKLGFRQLLEALSLPDPWPETNE